MLAVPVVDAVNVVLQVAVPAVVPAAKLQVVNAPVTPLTERFTVPVGVVGEVEVSVTVAVQLVAWLIATMDGLHTTFVVVPCLTAATVTVTV